MWRQLKGFKELKPHVLTWEHLNRERFPLGGIPVEILHFVPEPQNQKGTAKWLNRLQCLPQRNFLGSVGDERKAIRTYLKSIQPTVILAQFGFMGLRILPVAKEMGVPVVVHFHGLDISSSLNNRWYRWSLLNKLRDFSAIVVVGTHQKEWLLSQGILQQQVHLIPCGVPTDEFMPKDKCRSDLIRFLAVSRLVEKKGLEYTIQAFSKVLQQHATAQLHILGDGPLQEKLEQLAERLAIKSNVFFHGSVGGDVVNDQMRKADIFVQHSIVASSGDAEGFGVSVAEASSMELPVVCSNASGIVDQVIDGETGFLVPQKDVEAMAQRMLQLCDDADLREAMGKTGRRRMVQHYDTKKQIAKLEEVLLSVSNK